jgi:Trypsin/Leucine Rich repeats (2 copies)
MVLNKLQFLAIIIASVACNRFHRGSDLQIVGGQVAGWEQPFRRHVVGLADADQSMPHCTATIVGTNVALTAAHCIDSNQRSGGSKGFVYFGKGENGTPEVWLPIMELHVFGGGNRDLSGFFPNYDLAVVKFAGALPQGFQPANLLNDAASLSRFGGEMFLAGYGAQGFEGAMDMPINNYQVNFVGVPLLRYVDTPLQRAQIQFDQLATGAAKSSCFGDSGGPLFIQVGPGDYRLAGVANGTDPRLDHVRPARCSAGIGVYTFVGNYSKWLTDKGVPIQADEKVRQEFEEHVPTKAVHRDLNGWCKDFGSSYQEEAALHWIAWQVDEIACEALNQKSAVIEDLTPNLMFHADQISLKPLGVLPGLRRVMLRGAAIDPPSSIADLIQVRELNVTGSELLGLPDLSGLDQLESLRFTAGWLRADKLAGLPTHLKTLDLSDNNLAAFPAIAGLKKLQTLNLSGNDISEFPRDQPVSSVRDLNLSRNRLSTLAGLESFAQTQELDLTHNLISDWGHLSVLGQVNSLRIYGNPKTVSQCPISNPVDCVLSLPSDGTHRYYARGIAVANRDTFLQMMVADPARLPVSAKCPIPAGTELKLKFYTRNDRQISDERFLRFSLAEKLERCPAFTGGFIQRADFRLPPER